MNLFYVENATRFKFKKLEEDFKKLEKKEKKKLSKMLELFWCRGVKTKANDGSA